MIEAPKKPKNDNPDVPAQEMSKGEKWFNTIVYKLLNYWTNLGISLVITDVFLAGPGKGWFKSGVEKFSSTLMATGLSKGNSKWVAKQALGTLSLNSGGNILLVPTKILEDNKRSIVHWLNDKLGVDQTAPDGHKLTADEIYIEQEQAKQSWMRMIARRFVGWMATTATGMAMDKALAQKHETPIMVDGDLQTHKPGQDVFTDATLKAADYALKSGYIPGGKTFAENPMARRYMGYAALDWIYTMITSKILHATNGAHSAKMPAEIYEPTVATAPVTHDQQAPAVMPERSVAADIMRAKDQDETFAAAIARKQDTTNHHSLGV